MKIKFLMLMMLNHNHYAQNSEKQTPKQETIPVKIHSNETLIGEYSEFKVPLNTVFRISFDKNKNLIEVKPMESFGEIQKIIETFEITFKVSNAESEQKVNVVDSHRLVFIKHHNTIILWTISITPVAKWNTYILSIVSHDVSTTNQLPNDTEKRALKILEEEAKNVLKPFLRETKLKIQNYQLFLNNAPTTLD